MRKLIYFLCVVFFVVSCVDEKIEIEVTPELPTSVETVAVNSGILSFDTPDALRNTVDKLKEIDKFTLEVYPTTRSGSTDFTSLRQHLINQGLREFTDAELAEIMAKGLTYEPEDEIIIDPYLATILNQDREVLVNDKIYRYVDDGIVIYDADLIGQFDNSWMSNLNTSSMTHGQGVTINNQVTFTRVVVGTGTVAPVSPPSNGSGDTIYNDDGSLTLKSNGITIPANMVKRATYKKGNGDANWVQRTASGLCGTNVTLENNYDDRHRMKLRMYDQDYILYRAVGMTVRMQERTLGIWWRKKAQEFRYGWTAIECEYKFNAPAFPEPPKMPNGVPQYDKYPTTMTKKFPYEDTDIVLFHIPYANYDVTSGDINSVVAAGMKFIAGTMYSWYNSEEGKDYKNNPRGLYTTHDSDKKMLVTFPQGEDVAYNDGREVVRWELSWFSGTFILSFSNNLHGGGWNTKVQSVGITTDVNIIRGRIYAAVKYDNQWRACVIETES